MDTAVEAEQIAAGVALNGYYSMFEEQGLASEHFNDQRLRDIVKVYEKYPNATPMRVQSKTGCQLADLSRLMDNGFSVELLPDAAERVIEAWKVRSIKDTCNRLSEGHVTVNDAVLKLQQVDTYGAQKTEKPTAQWGEYTDALEDIYKSGGEEAGLSTGIPLLDKAYFSLQPGTVHVVAARPGGGKTAIALQLAINTTKTDRCHFFSYEMSQRRLMDRIAGNLAKVNMRMFKSSPTDKMAERVAGSMAKNSNVMNRLSISECYGWSFGDLKRQALLLAKQGVKMFVLDYLQIVKAPAGRYSSRSEEVAKLSAGVAELARLTKTVWIVLVQANRELDKRAPYMSDLKESGAIEADADTVAFLVPSETQGIIEHHLLKNRDGFTGTTKLIFNKSTQSFHEPEPSSQPG